jgi:competence protein ComEA
MGAGLPLQSCVPGPLRPDFINLARRVSMWKKFVAALVMFCAAAMAMALDVNKATEAELDNLKGIGPVTSKLILAERKKAHFKDWQDFIDRVKGVGESRAAKFSEEGLTVNGQSFKVAATTKKDDKAAAKSDAKDAKSAAKSEAKEAKTAAKDEKKEVKAAAKEEKKEAKATAKADSAKPAASAARK